MKIKEKIIYGMEEILKYADKIYMERDHIYFYDKNEKMGIIPLTNMRSEEYIKFMYVLFKSK